MKAQKKLTFLFLLLNISSFAQNGFTLNIDAVKLAYDGKRDLIYAITSGRNLVNGNSLVAISSNGQVVKSIFVGSEPNNLVFTSDTNYLFISFTELAMVKRVDLSTYQVDQQFGLGSSVYYGSYFGNSLATIPGENNIVVVSRVRKNVSPTFAGLAVFKNGTELPKSTPDHTGPEFICTTGKDTIYGQGSDKLYTIRISKDSGAYILSSITTSYLPDMKFENGFLYGSSGYVVDTRLGQPYQYGLIKINEQSGYYKVGLYPDAQKNKVFTSTFSNSKITLQSFDITTLLKNNKYEIPFQLPQGFTSPNIRDLIRVGRYGLATIVYEDYSFGSNLAHIALANNLAFVDSSVINEPKEPRPLWYDTVLVHIYDTVVLQTNDTLVFPMFIRTGTTEELLATFRVYPNPTSEYLYIDTQVSPNHFSGFYLQISDMQGKVLVGTSVQSWGGYINVSDLAKGSYIFEISDPTTGARVQKIIIVQ